MISRQQSNCEIIKSLVFFPITMTIDDGFNLCSMHNTHQRHIFLHANLLSSHSNNSHQTDHMMCCYSNGHKTWHSSLHTTGFHILRKWLRDIHVGLYKTKYIVFNMGKSICFKINNISRIKCNTNTTPYLKYCNDTYFHV